MTKKRHPLLGRQAVLAGTSAQFQPAIEAFYELGSAKTGEHPLIRLFHPIPKSKFHTQDHTRVGGTNTVRALVLVKDFFGGQVFGCKWLTMNGIYNSIRRRLPVDEGWQTLFPSCWDLVFEVSDVPPVSSPDNLATVQDDSIWLQAEVRAFEVFYQGFPGGEMETDILLAQLGVLLHHSRWPTPFEGEAALIIGVDKPGSFGPQDPGFRSRKKITAATSLVLLAKDFVTHSLQIARICASFVPCPWPKFRRELATFICFRLLT